MWSLLIIFALFIDGLTAMLLLTLFGVTATASLVPGVVVFAGPIGLIMGVVLSFAINITMGSALILALRVNGALYPKIAVSAFLGELVPGLNALPCWTAMTAVALWRKHKEEKVAEATATPQSGATTGVKVQPVASDGIRPRTPANDKNSAYAKAA